MAVELAHYLLQQGLAAGQITILTPYTGQLRYSRGLAAGQLRYSKGLAAGQLRYSRGLAAGQLRYSRGLVAGQLRYSRGLAAGLITILTLIHWSAHV